MLPPTRQLVAGWICARVHRQLQQVEASARSLMHTVGDMTTGCED